MKRLVYSKSIQQPKRNVIGYLPIFIDLVIPDEEAIAASLTSTSYPGRDAFLQDVTDILTQEKGCTILDKHNSNSKKSNSPSIYFVLEYPLSATKSIICTIFLRVSNHRSNFETYYSTDRQHYIDLVKNKYLNAHSVLFDEVEIITEMEAPNKYQDALNEIRCQFDNAINEIKSVHYDLLK